MEEQEKSEKEDLQRKLELATKLLDQLSLHLQQTQLPPREQIQRVERQLQDSVKIPKWFLGVVAVLVGPIVGWSIWVSSVVHSLSGLEERVHLHNTDRSLHHYLRQKVESDIDRLDREIQQLKAGP